MNVATRLLHLKKLIRFRLFGKHFSIIYFITNAAAYAKATLVKTYFLFLFHLCVSLFAALFILASFFFSILFQISKFDILTFFQSIDYKYLYVVQKVQINSYFFFYIEIPNLCASPSVSETVLFLLTYWGYDYLTWKWDYFYCFLSNVICFRANGYWRLSLSSFQVLFCVDKK